MTTVTIDVPDLAATENVGRLLAEHLPNGSVVALIGTLGAGKTKLVQAVAKYTGIEEETVSSPTFVLLHEYDGDRPIYHFDAYRLESEREFRRLSPDDYFEGTGLTFIEWADKFPNVLPSNYLEIRIEMVSETKRRFHLSAHGKEFEKVCANTAPSSTSTTPPQSPHC